MGQGLAKVIEPTEELFDCLARLRAKSLLNGGDAVDWANEANAKCIEVSRCVRVDVHASACKLAVCGKAAK